MESDFQRFMERTSEEIRVMREENERLKQAAGRQVVLAQRRLRRNELRRLARKRNRHKTAERENFMQRERRRKKKAA